MLDFDDLIERITSWATEHPDVRAALILGSGRLAPITLPMNGPTWIFWFLPINRNSSSNQPSGQRQLHQPGCHFRAYR